jgi:hypothetical protein
VLVLAVHSVVFAETVELLVFGFSGRVSVVVADSLRIFFEQFEFDIYTIHLN